MNHGHIYGQVRCARSARRRAGELLREGGGARGGVRQVPARMAALGGEQEILDNQSIDLIASAAIASERAGSASAR